MGLVTMADEVLCGAGALLAIGATVRWMIRANRADQRIIDKRYQEWIDGGSVPEEKPSFYSGPSS